MDKAQSFADWRAARVAIEQELEAIGKRWKAIPGNGAGPMGLTPDSVKAGADWQSCHADYWRAHRALQRHNGGAPRAYLKQFAQERRAAIAAERARP